MIQKYSSIESIKDVWQKSYESNHPLSPFATDRWYRLWFDVFGHAWEPWIVVINNTVVAPFVRQENTITFSGGVEISDYMDLIGPDDEKALVWPELLKYLTGLGVKYLQLHNIPESSATYKFFKGLSSSQSTILINQEDTTPIVHLPSLWDEYQKILKRDDRHELRRKLRNFEAQHPNCSLIESKNIDSDIADVIRLMALDSKKKEFLTPSMQMFFSQLPQIFPTETKILFLEAGGKNVAAILAFLVDKTLYLYNSGFDEEHYSGAGFYLKAMAIKWAIEHEAKEFNFLQGSERYKYDLGGKDFFVYKIIVSL